MAPVPRLASVLLLLQASPNGADSVLAACTSNFTALAGSGEKIGLMTDFSQRAQIAENSVRVQLVELLVFAVLWWIAFSKIRSLAFFLLESKPWFEKAVVRTQESMRKSIGVEVELTEAARGYTQGVALATLHMTGSLLCLPAIFGVLPPEVFSALTRLAALSEVACELMDVCGQPAAHGRVLGALPPELRGAVGGNAALSEVLGEIMSIIEKAHQRWIKPCAEKGRQEVPSSMLFIVACHHLLAMPLVMPVNFFYSDARGYAVLVLALHFAAGASHAISAYVFSLDLQRPSQLFQMQAMAVSQVLCAVSFKGVLFAVAVGDLLGLFLRDQARVFLMFFVPAVLCMSVLNYIFIYDSWRRMRRFLRWAPEQRPAEGAAAAAAAQGPSVCPRGLRRLSAASIAAVRLSGGPMGLLQRRRSSVEADMAAAAAAAAAAAQATAEAAKDRRTPSSTLDDGQEEDEDSSDFGASSDDEEQ